MPKVSQEKNDTIIYRIEPFYFDKKFEEINTFTGFEPYKLSKNMFYDHINQLMFLGEDSIVYNNQIGKAFIQKNKITKFSTSEGKYTFPIISTKFKYFIENIINEETNQPIGKRFVYFNIKNVQILISEMQVGFLVYDLNIIKLYDEINGVEHEREITLENYDLIMYQLRHLQNENYPPSVCIKAPEDIQKIAEYHKIKGEKKCIEEPRDILVSVKWVDLTNKLLEEIGNVYSFADRTKIGHHSLLYSCSLIQTPNDLNNTSHEDFELEVANKVFKISHGYKKTYYKNSTLEDINRPFDNVMWGFSAEGVSNMIYSVSDRQAIEFFKSSFHSKWATNYYFMYILALLQKYSLLYYSMRATDILLQSSVYLGKDVSELTMEQREEELKRIQQFHAKILKFTIHGYYEQISYHTHYNDLYEDLMKKLRISELQQELSPKMEAFSQVIKTLVHEQNTKEQEMIREETQKLQDEERRVQEKQNNIIQTITYFLLPATLATGIMGMNIPFISGSEDIYLLYTILLITTLTAGLSVLLNKEMKGIPAKFVAGVSFFILVLLVAVQIIWEIYDK